MHKLHFSEPKAPSTIFLLSMIWTTQKSLGGVEMGQASTIITTETDTKPERTSINLKPLYPPLKSPSIHTGSLEVWENSY